jgi:hypothetical protein
VSDLALLDLSRHSLHGANDVIDQFFSPPCEKPSQRFISDQARSKRSRFITLFQAATKSLTKFS